ncbi:hypothetical protein [Catenovulum agarivorans]|uniref:hypothetical protein n=1 Tax=Catenovulum agarivorans TaxID=1172192 RepID=UPI00031FEFCE|nr:hypothetical protein [Catenovulum agarivorans]
MLKRIGLIATCAALSACGDFEVEISSDKEPEVQYQRLISRSVFTLAEYADIAKLLQSSELQQLIAARQSYTEYQYSDDSNLTAQIEWSEQGHISQQTSISLKQDGEYTTASISNVSYKDDSTLSKIETNTEELWNNSKRNRETSTVTTIFYDTSGSELDNILSDQTFHYNDNNQLSTVTRSDEQNPQGYLEFEYTYTDHTEFYTLEIFAPDGTTLLNVERNWDNQGRVQADIATSLLPSKLVSIHFFIYNNEIDTITYFQMTADEYKSGQLIQDITVSVSQYDDIEKCGEFDLMVMDLFPRGNCRTKPELPSTTSLPTTSELGL